MQVGFDMIQNQGGIPEEWLILDSGSTDTVFCSCNFLKDIIACTDEESLDLTSNSGGAMEYYLKSEMKIFPISVFYNEDSLANIISLFNLIKAPGVHIHMDSSIDYGFKVTYDGKIYHFKPFDTGLYYYDTTDTPVLAADNTSLVKNNNVVSSYSFIQTVEDNKKNF